MKWAFITDIHGNPLALQAVLDDIAALGGVDGYWFLGDHTALGYDPVTPLEMITRLPNAIYLRGNTDRYTYSPADRPPPTLSESIGNSDKIQVLLEVAGSFAWTQGHLAATGWLPWLKQLPVEQRMTLPDGTRLLAVHASPGKDDGVGFAPQTEPKWLDLIDGCTDELVLVGHTHRRLDVNVNGIRVVNPGSVSNPLESDLLASYVILHADRNSYEIELRRVDYDHAAVIAAVEAQDHPGGAYICRFQRGEVH